MSAPATSPRTSHKSAKLRRAVNDLVLSKSFDNGMICASEQAVILDDEIYDAALAEFRTLHAHLATAEEKAKLETFLFPAGEAPGAGCEPKVNSAVVGQSSEWIAEQAGFTVPADTSLILVEAERVGPDEPLTREKLCPVLAVLARRFTGAGLRPRRRHGRLPRPGAQRRHPHRGPRNWPRRTAGA